MDLKVEQRDKHVQSYIRMTIVLGRDTIVLMKLHDQSKMGKERVYFAYISIPLFIMKRGLGQELKQDRNLEAEVDTEAMKVC